MPGTEPLPVVYVRGYAGGTSGINSVVKDPFYGFNEGSTHVRVGPQNTPQFHQFESPLLRLLLDERYHLLVQGNQDAYLDSHDDIPSASIWVHRFYDKSATTWGGPTQGFRIEDAALDLLRLIEQLKQKTGAPRVHLVAHSMGGLICRCLLQKMLPDLGRTPTDYVDKLFTYGTPHGGITFDVGFGLAEQLRDTLGVNEADMFGPRRMYEYLTPKSAVTGSPDGPPGGWDARVMPTGPGDLPLPHVFCLVGTDPTDYEVALGLSSFAVGARSDGLVQIDNAYVPGAHRAYVHRSHSGRYGLVNSEEGYQNLRRFLFGDTRIEAALVDHRLSDDRADVSWQAEAQLSIRGLPVVLHERMSAHWCPLQLPPPAPDGTPAAPLVLATTFLSSRAPRPAGAATMRYGLLVRILSVRTRDGILWFNDHLEQTADFSDTLIVDIGTSETGRCGVWADWQSDIDGAIRDHRPSGQPRPIEDEDPDSGVWRVHIGLPGKARSLLGERAAIRLTATPWQ